MMERMTMTHQEYTDLIYCIWRDYSFNFHELLVYCSHEDMVMVRHVLYRCSSCVQMLRIRQMKGYIQSKKYNMDETLVMINKIYLICLTKRGLNV